MHALSEIAVPQPRPRRAFANLADFMAEPVEFMRHLALQSEITRLRLGPKPFVFVFSPEAAQEILVKRADVYVQNRTVFDRIQPVTGKKGLVQLNGAESRVARARSRALFTPTSLERAQAIIESYTSEMLQKLSMSFDVTEEMTLLILKTALGIFLGAEATDLASQIGEKFLRLNFLCGLRMRALLPPPLFVPTSKNREIRRLRAEIRSLVGKHIAGQTNGVPGAFSGDEAVLDHCMTFLFAGHETTAASLSFTLLLLARHPEFQEAIAAGDEDVALRCYKESLRLFPPAYMLAREATADDELCGMHVKKGDQVIIGVTAIQRNPELFELPENFLPGRFREKLRQQFSFIPFGAGAKSCVGERLAYLEAVIVLKAICKEFRLSAESGPIRCEPLITLHPLPNQLIHLERRAHASN